MISVRCPSIAVVALVAAMAAASLVAAHDDNGDGFHWTVYDGRQTQADAFADCLCWNTTTHKWCHNSNDGPNTGFWRDSCARVVFMNTWWWIPVVLWCLYLIFMPLFMCAFRLCCNCCGGRTPSFGCCCPISNRILSSDPKWTRPYSRCATWTAKILALIVGIVVLTTSIHSFHNNMLVNVDVQMTSEASNRLISATIEHIERADPSGSSSSMKTKPAWLNAAAFGAINKLQSALPTLRTMHRDFSEAKEEDRKHRASPTYSLVAIPLTLVMLVTILAFCNVRSWCTSISAGLLSFVTVFIVIIASVVMTGALTVDLYCDNRDAVRTFAKQVLSAPEYGYCNRTDVALATNQTQIQFVRSICADLGLAKMIAAGNNSKKYVGPNSIYTHPFCEEKVGGMLAERIPRANVEGGMFYFYRVSSSGSISDPMVTIVDTERFFSIVHSPDWAPIPDYKYYGRDLSISGCSIISECPMHAQAKTIMSQAKFALTEMNLFQVLNQDCNVVTVLSEGLLDPMLCTGTSGSWYGSRFYFTPVVRASRDLHNLAGALFGLAGTCTIAFWIWMNGSKRFTKAANKEELLGHHAAQRERMTQLSYGYQQHTNQQTTIPTAEPVQVGTYNDGHNGPAPVATRAVADTQEQPLLLSHQTPTYDSVVATGGSVNNRQAGDVELPEKQQPEPI